MGNPSANVRTVHVIETWLKHRRSWHAWGVRVSRTDAWNYAREVRLAYPDQKFRVIPYQSVKP